MKKLRFSVGAIAILILGFYACKKESASQSTAPNKVPSKGALARNTAGNPLDYLGAIHNQYLDAVGGQPDFRSMSSQDRYDLWVNFNSTALPGVSMSYEEFTEIGQEAFAPVPASFSVLESLSQQGVPSDAIQDLQALFNTVGFRADMTAGGILTISEAVATTENWEDSVMAKYGMPPADASKEISLNTDAGKAAWLLGTAAILKSSYAYWMAVEANPQSPWYVAMPPNGGNTWGEPAMRPLREIWADIKGWCRQVKVDASLGLSVDLGRAAASAELASNDAAM